MSLFVNFCLLLDDNEYSFTEQMSIKWTIFALRESPMAPFGSRQAQISISFYNLLEPYLFTTQNYGQKSSPPHLTKLLEHDTIRARKQSY